MTDWNPRRSGSLVSWVRSTVRGLSLTTNKRSPSWMKSSGPTWCTSGEKGDSPCANCIQLCSAKRRWRWWSKAYNHWRSPGPGFDWSTHTPTELGATPTGPGSPPTWTGSTPTSSRPSSTWTSPSLSPGRSSSRATRGWLTEWCWSRGKCSGTSRPGQSTVDRGLWVGNFTTISSYTSVPPGSGTVNPSLWAGDPGNNPSVLRSFGWLISDFEKLNINKICWVFTKRSGNTTYMIYH